MEKVILSRFEKAADLLPYLKKHIMGQDHILEKFSTTIAHGWCHITDTEKTRGNFFLLGPTGTGKTELIRQSVKYFYKSENNLLRIDMSEYGKLAGDDILKKLIGSPNEGGGRLGDFLEKHDEGFILYDEIEKANPDFFTILLQQLDDARITLGNNKTYDLSKFFIVCTSNIGAQLFQNSKHMSKQHIKRAINSSLKRRFSPEFVARFGQFETGILIYKKLETKHLRAITKKFVDLHIKKINEKNFLNFNIKGYGEDLITQIIFKTDKKNGARDIYHIAKDTIQTSTYNFISENKNILEHGAEQRPTMAEGWLNVKDSQCHFTVENNMGGKTYDIY